VEQNVLPKLGADHFDGSHVNFTVTVHNKKDKALNIKISPCELYSGSNKIDERPCDDIDTVRRSAGAIKYDELQGIDVDLKPSIIKKIKVPVSGDLTSCDKVVFRYSWGIKKEMRLFGTRRICSMLKLERSGNDKVVNHHQEIPCRVLER
jgi:hypothetical protein